MLVNCAKHTQKQGASA